MKNYTQQDLIDVLNIGIEIGKLLEKCELPEEIVHAYAGAESEDAKFLILTDYYHMHLKKSSTEHGKDKA